MKIKSLSGYLCALALFSFLIAGCANDDSGDDAPSLPAVEDLPTFVGDFVGSEAAAKGLVAEAIAAISDLTGEIEPSMFGSYRSGLVRNTRATESISDEKTDLVLEAGAVISYKIDGTMTISTKDEDGLPQAGDFMEMEYTMTDELKLTDWKSDEGSTVNGKMNGNSAVSAKMTFASDGDMSMNQVVSSKESYALSISKSGVGLRYAYASDIKAKITDIFGSYTWEKFSVTIKVYDNDNALKIDKSFTNAQAYADWLGADAGGLLNLR